MATNDEPALYIERPNITCPSCRASWPLGKRRGPFHQLHGAKPQGDGSERARIECDCGHRFPVVFEPLEDFI